MKRVLSLLAAAIIFICPVCFADVLKGHIEKVNIKNYEIVVNGERVNVSKATIFTENDLNVVKNVITRDLKDHEGKKVICYGSIGKDNIFEAYKVKVIEEHK